MGRLFDADKLKADLEKAISKNEDMDCLDFLRIASVIDAQPTAYNLNEVIANLEEYFEENENEENSGFIEVCIDIVKDGVADPCAECIEVGGCQIREDCPNEGKKKSKSDMIVEQLEERTAFLKDCTKYGNKTAEQQSKSYDTMMMYEVADLVDDLIEIVKGGGVDA